MVVLVIAMLLCVAVAGGVLALVALPRLRGGDRLLTPDGRDAVDEAARRARALAAGRGPRGTPTSTPTSAPSPTPTSAPTPPVEPAGPAAGTGPAAPESSWQRDQGGTRAAADADRTDVVDVRHPVDAPHRA